jgi:uncharacterized protein YjiS (DUF1127 family)
MKIDVKRAGVGLAVPFDRLIREGLQRLLSRAQRWLCDSRKLRDVERLLDSDERLLRDAGLRREDLWAEAVQLRARLRP